MSRLLLNLRHVPDDEAEEVHALMRRHGIACYITPPGPFRISAGGIWLKHREDYPRACELMDDYQHERQEKAREAWRQARESGQADTLWSNIVRRPLTVLLAVAASIFILLVLFAPLVVFFRLAAG
ncbi:MAG TPA: DUF6164 family protein [Wenzhouxiangella sp.]|nr:DUF6164 family protein [Wenzhouxiangella sp.]